MALAGMMSLTALKAMLAMTSLIALISQGKHDIPFSPYSPYIHDSHEINDIHGNPVSSDSLVIPNILNIYDCPDRSDRHANIPVHCTSLKTHI